MASGSRECAHDDKLRLLHRACVLRTPVAVSRYFQRNRRERRVVFPSWAGAFTLPQAIVGFMVTRPRTARAAIAIFFAAGVLAAAPTAAQPSDKVGPPLETVKAFGDDFRLVGIA